jgi:hypothetical protein
LSQPPPRRNEPRTLAPAGVRQVASGSREEVAFTLLTTLAIWSYALVGGAAIVTVFFKSGSSPESVKAVASAFVGLVFALFNQVFQSPR